MKKKKKVSIQDIADKLGVSKGTVSLVLSGKAEGSRISDEMSKKVKETAEEMVSSTISDYKIIDERLQKGINLTGEAGDDSTQDLLIGYKSGVDKTIWMLQAFLGKNPLDA